MKAGKIFINYRREDSRADAGRLYDRLHALYPDRVFRDVGSLEPGIEWREAIDKVLSNADACIVVIGKNWLTMTDAAGKRRLDDPKDTVRQELQTALSERHARVSPSWWAAPRCRPKRSCPANCRRSRAGTRSRSANRTGTRISRSWSRRSSGRWDGRRPSPKGRDSALPSTQSVDRVAALVVIGVVGAMFLGGEPAKKDEPPAVRPPAADDVKPQQVTPAPVAPVQAAETQAPPPAPVERPRAVTPPPPVTKEAEVPPAAPQAPPPRRASNVDNAQDALTSGRLVAPRNDSALHWALQAQQANEPGAFNVIERVNDAILNEMKEMTKDKRFDDELAFLNVYAQYYPANSPMQRTIQQVRDQIRQAQQGVRLQVIHRHGIDYRSARCEGWLEIDPAGTVSYAWTEPSRRPQTLHPEQLHLTTASGNFDFFAPQPTIAASLRALAASGARLQTK